MKLCPKCDHSPWPFFMAFLIAGISAFATWLTLGLSSMDVTLRAVVSALTFATVGGTLLHYIFSCIKRHCRHDDGPPRPLPDPCLPVRQQTVAHRPG